MNVVSYLRRCFHEAPWGSGTLCYLSCILYAQQRQRRVLLCEHCHHFSSCQSLINRNYLHHYWVWRASWPINQCFHVQSREQIKISLWNDHFVEYGRTVCMFRTEKIRKLVAMGIPESLRGRLWLLFSGRSWHVQAFCDLWNRLRKGFLWTVCKAEALCLWIVAVNPQCGLGNTWLAMVPP